MKKKVKTEKSEKLVERVEIENSPFVAVKVSNETWILTLGKYKISNKSYKSLEECKQPVINKEWELLFTVIAIVSEETNKN